jgi:DNA transposition AAA+ family ATPase
MRRIFAKTSNVVRLVNALAPLKERNEDLPGMVLVFGQPGLGKTKAMLWWQLQNGAAYIRAIKVMTARWLLEAIVSELGETPRHRTSDLWRQCVEILIDRSRTLIVDEVDYLAYDARVLELLRDLHDVTGSPIIFVGMENADKKLSRYRHLYDRFIEVVRFQPFTKADIADIATQLCEVTLTADAIDLIYGDGPRFRQAIKWFYRAEAIARANSLKEVNASILAQRT